MCDINASKKTWAVRLDYKNSRSVKGSLCWHVRQLPEVVVVNVPRRQNHWEER